jgi:gluconolactonase
MEMTRRHVLKATAAAGAITFTRTALGGWEPSERYPDPAIKSLDPGFNRYRLFNASIERLATGMRWCEGPVWFGDVRCLIWSDIPNNTLMRWDEETGAVSIYRKPANYANGNTRDRQGRLISCEHETRSVTRTEYDGSITVLMDRFEGKRLNSPNDVSVKSDDSIWFSDPPFGLRTNYQGNIAPSELPSNIYRLDPKTGRATVVESTLDLPNGVEFSPDESKCYIEDSASRSIYAYDVVDEGNRLVNKRVLITAESNGTPDGFRVDMDGNLWCGWGMGNAELDGVKVFNREGKPIGFIALPERCANLTFGGRKRNRLFMTASHSLYSLYVNARGAKNA